MFRYLLILVICTLCQPSAVAQEVWPGDLNNNGVVNGVDLLYWGVAFGATGPARATVATDWAPQASAPPWTQSFPSGINYSFADCDGNGEVDGEDYDNAIEQNFGLTHGEITPDGFSNAGTGPAPRLHMVPSTTLVELGGIIDIDLFLDDTEQPVTDFYGIALKMSYTTGLLEDDSGPDFDFTEDSWLEANDDNAVGLFHDGDGSGRAELAFTRTTQTAVAVESGAIGRFHVVVEDIIVGLEIDTFILSIDSIFLIGPEVSTVATGADTIQIVIARDTSKITATDNLLPSQLERKIKVFPNPARASIQLSSPLPIERLTLVDPLGNAQELTAPRFSMVPQRVLLPPGLRSGLYYLHLQTSSGSCTKKIMISR